MSVPRRKLGEDTIAVFHSVTIPLVVIKKGVSLVFQKSLSIVFPNSEKGKTWIQKVRHDPGSDFIINKRTKVCSEHFTPDDFVFGNLSLNGGRRRLKQSAIPSVFAWTRGKNKRTSLTSQKALQPLMIDNSVKEIQNNSDN